MDSLPRFNINYDRSGKGEERLTIKCNFPDRESGALRTSRTYFGPRARVRWQKIQKLAQMTAAEMDHWIVYHCGVGGTKFWKRNPDPEGHLFIPITVNKLIAELGRIPQVGEI